MKPFLIAIAVLALGACAQVKLAAVNLTQFTFEGEIVRNMAYGDLPRQKLDIYLPEKQLSGASWPVIIFIHGGRWSSGERTDYAFMGSTLARAGYITVIPSYRLYPQVKLPEMMDDIAAALAWVDRHIEAYHAQAEDVFLIGHSSGAHMGALLLANPDYLKKYDLTADRISAFVGMAGPYDFTPSEPDLVDLFGPPSNFPAMNVSHFIQGNEPPMFLLHGLRDELVLPGNMERLEEAIQAKGGDVTTKLYHEVTHEDMLKAFTWADGDEAKIRADIVNFLRQYQVNDGIMIRPGVAPWKTYRGVSGNRN